VAPTLVVQRLVALTLLPHLLETKEVANKVAPSLG